MAGPRGSARIPLTPLAIVMVLALSWPLPLAWTSLALATVALVSLVVAHLVQAHGVVSLQMRFGTITAATWCLAAVASIALGYAAFALTTGESFGGATRLGYPFLIATHLYLRGGLMLLLLCAAVGSVPLLFER